MDLRLTKARVLLSLPPGGYQHVEGIVDALRAQIFRSEFMRMGFQWILVVSWVGSLEIGV
jgi:hypothetical protein